MLSCVSVAVSAKDTDRFESAAMAERRVRKRPAAHAMLVPDADMSLSSLRGQQRAAMLRGLPTEQPDWEKHVIDMFDGELLFITQTLGIKRITLNVWCDCAGLVVEGFALNRLAKRLMERSSLDVSIKVFNACEKKAALHTFIKENHLPTHMSDDVLNRDWVGKRFECSTTGQWLDIPSVGIDLYVAGFPCSPWTRNGLRKGLGDPNSQQCFASIKTIKALQPRLYVLENVMECTRANEGEDFKAILEFLNAELPNYGHSANLGIDPTQRGFPMFRARLMLGGGNHAGVKQDLLVQYVGKVLSTPLPLTVTYWDFLRLGEPLQLGRLHQPPNPYETAAIKESGCTCGLDPMTLCEVHVCKCSLCKKEVGLKCEWRKKATEFIMNTLKLDVDENGKIEQHLLAEITYLQAIELFSGLAVARLGPASPRERNMLNLAARKPNLQPLNKSLAVMDISCSIDHVSPNASGAVPTIGTNALPWVFALGKCLNIYQIGMLFGHNMAEIKLDSCNDAVWRIALGNSLHVATTGSLLFPMIIAALVGHNQQP